MQAQQKSAMFQYVKDMNTAFGNHEGDPQDYERIADAPEGVIPYNADAWNRLFKQCANIAGVHQEVKGEARELLDAIVARDVEGTRDALCDVMVFALGAYHFLGYDADADMEAVLNGVMTRFCRGEKELADTVHHWAQQGITDVYAEGHFPRVCVKARTDQTSNSGEFVPAGKFLKSTGYKQTVFPPAPSKQPPTLAVSRQFLGMPPAAAPTGRPHMAEASSPYRKPEGAE